MRDSQLTKAEARDALVRVIASRPPWESYTAAEQAEIDRLKAIAYPGGLNDMLREAGVR